MSLQHLTFVVDDAPQVVSLAIDLDEHLIEMPLKVTKAAYLGEAFLADLRGKQGAETGPPISDRFVANVDPAFVEQVLHVSQRKRETDIHHHRETNEFRRRFEVAEGRRFHIRRGSRLRHLAKQAGSSDRTRMTPYVQRVPKRGEY